MKFCINLLLWVLLSMLPIFSTTLMEIRRGIRKKYFLTIMTRVRDEINGILEFVQHYLEEGVDHFYIFDDGSTDGTVEALGCIPSEYYTVFTSADLTMEEVEYFRVHWRHNIMQYEQLYEMYNLLGVRDSSEWVMVVDVDELMVSRAQPQLTIREVLMSKLSHCDIVSVPWLIFSWGNMNETVPNAVRYRLYYRWGFDSKYVYMNRNGDRLDGKFRNIDYAVNVKAIVRTRTVPVVGSVHWADFRSSLRENENHKPGIVCIAHASKHLQCASSCADYVDLAEESKKTHSFGLVGNHMPTTDENCSETGRLSAFCPPMNEFYAINSPREIKITESDVDRLLLGIHHYRVVSLEDFDRKRSANRSTEKNYHTSYLDAVNRKDVVDTFMVEKRLPPLRRSSRYQEVLNLMKPCQSSVFNPIRTGKALHHAHATLKGAGLLTTTDE